MDKSTDQKETSKLAEIDKQIDEIEHFFLIEDNINSDEKLFHFFLKICKKCIEINVNPKEYDPIVKLHISYYTSLIDKTRKTIIKHLLLKNECFSEIIGAHFKYGILYRDYKIGDDKIITSEKRYVKTKDPIGSFFTKTFK